jgi:N utilization substance protein A
VPDYQLSLAIGKEGQNARLAARLTGWRIDIRSDTAEAAASAASAGPAGAAPGGADAQAL